MAKKRHMYKGRNIFPCVYADHVAAGQRWYVEVFGGSNADISCDEQISPRFHTLADAKAHIDQAEA